MTHPLILKLNQEKQEFSKLIADMRTHVEAWSNDYTIQQKNLEKMIDELGFSRDTGFDYQSPHEKMVVEHLVVSHPCGLVIGIDHQSPSFRNCFINLYLVERDIPLSHYTNQEGNGYQINLQGQNFTCNRFFKSSYIETKGKLIEFINKVEEKKMFHLPINQWNKEVIGSIFDGYNTNEERYITSSKNTIIGNLYKDYFLNKEEDIPYKISFFHETINKKIKNLFATHYRKKNKEFPENEEAKMGSEHHTQVLALSESMFKYLCGYETELLKEEIEEGLAEYGIEGILLFELKLMTFMEFDEYFINDDPVVEHCFSSIMDELNSMDETAVNSFFNQHGISLIEKTLVANPSSLPKLTFILESQLNRFERLNFLATNSLSFENPEIQKLICENKKSSDNQKQCIESFLKDYAFMLDENKINNLLIPSLHDNKKNIANENFKWVIQIINESNIKNNLNKIAVERTQPSFRL